MHYALLKVLIDLVEIVANAEPPVCKIMDFNKHLFDLKQKQKEAKKKQHQVQVKEIKLRPVLMLVITT